MQKAHADPDGDNLIYKWWHYNEADTYDKSIAIKNNTSQTTEISVPENSNGKNIHLILEVKDNGQPVLTAYRRIIIACKQ